MIKDNPLIQAYLEDRATWDFDPDVDGEDGPEARWLWYLENNEYDIEHTEEDVIYAVAYIEIVQKAMEYGYVLSEDGEELVHPSNTEDGK